MKFIRKIKGGNWLAVSSLILVFAFSLIIPATIYNKIKSDLYKEKEVSIVSSGKILNRYIIDTYELYSDSGTLKFKEVMSNIKGLSRDFNNFQIISVEGNVLYDSRYEDFSLNEKSADAGLGKDVLSSKEININKSGGTVDSVIVPHIDDWGNHKYSVRYFTSYSDITEKLRSFKIMMVTVAGGINLVLIFILISFSFNEKYRLEKERGRDLEKLNNVKDEFMILVSHNLRTPLSIIRGYMSFISDPDGKKEELDKNISDMRVGVNKLADLVEDIVYVTSIISEEAKFETEKINLNKLTGEVVNKHKDQIKGKGLKIKYLLEGEEDFMGDGKALNRIIDNLLENAIKFNRDNGSIDIKMENGKELKMTFSDTGVGIEKERLEDIVGFFHRGSETLDYNFEGKGLGLYLTNLIVKHYNGLMHVVSEKDKGSTFEVTLRSS